MKVNIVQYDPSWADKFEELKREIKAACGSKVHSIEHIGSTAVPGLGAKPVIDILLGVSSAENLDHIIPDLLGADYVYISDFEHTMPYRRYFRRKGEVHVHAVEINSDFWKRHLAFRDYLRHYDSARDDYYRLKSELAEKDWEDSNDYAYAKTEFVRSIEKLAVDTISGKCELAEANSIFDSYAAVTVETARLCGMKSAIFGSAAAIRTDSAPIVLTNRVVGLGINTPIDEKLLDQIIAFYGTESKVFGLQIPPSKVNSETESLLSKHGFKNTGYWIRYYRTAERADDVNTKLKVREIGNEDAVTFGKLLCRIYEMPEIFVPYFGAVAGRKNWICFMAYEGDKPVSAASMYIDDDTAWIGMAGTLAECRNKGAQKAMISARINTANEAGCKWITVETGPDSAEKPNPSAKNVLKMGFRQLYNRPNYVLKAEEKN